MVDLFKSGFSAVAVAAVQASRKSDSVGNSTGLNFQRQRIYQHFVQQFSNRLDLRPVQAWVDRLGSGIEPLGLRADVRQCGPLFDYAYQPQNLELIAAVHKYEKLPIPKAIIATGQLCQRCRSLARIHYHFSSTAVSKKSKCRWCKVLDPRHALEVTALMNPKIFEKFITYDSFFGNYLVKRYADMLRENDKYSQPSTDLSQEGIKDDYYPEYFDQMLLQVMDHSNDIRVQNYFNDLRNLPMDKIANDRTVVSPYIMREGKSVYDNLKMGRRARNTVDEKPVKVTSRYKPLWESRIIKRRYTVNNLPVYPSSIIYWVKQTQKKAPYQFKVLCFKPPQAFKGQVMAFILTKSQADQLFSPSPYRPDNYSQQELDHYWKLSPTVKAAL